MKWTEVLTHSIDTVNLWVGRIVSWLIVVATVLMLYEVVTRRLLGKPTVWTGEIVTMVYGAFFILLMGYTLRENAHVRVDVFSARWPKRVQLIADLAGYLLFFSIFSIVCLIGGAKLAAESWSTMEGTGTILNFPLWPVRATIPLGFALLLLQGISEFIKDSAALKEKKNGI